MILLETFFKLACKNGEKEKQVFIIAIKQIFRVPWFVKWKIVFCIRFLREQRRNQEAFKFLLQVFPRYNVVRKIERRAMFILCLGVFYKCVMWLFVSSCVRIIRVVSLKTRHKFALQRRWKTTRKENRYTFK